MNNTDKKAILSMVASIQSQLDAVRAILSDDEPAPQPVGCPHNDFTTIQTMGGMQGGFCNDCGQEFVMGVLDKDENNE